MPFSLSYREQIKIIISQATTSLEVRHICLQTNRVTCVDNILLDDFIYNISYVTMTTQQSHWDIDVTRKDIHLDMNIFMKASYFDSSYFTVKQIHS